MADSDIGRVEGLDNDYPTTPPVPNCASGWVSRTNLVLP